MSSSTLRYECRRLVKDGDDHKRIIFADDEKDAAERYAQLFVKQRPREAVELDQFKVIVVQMSPGDPTRKYRNMTTWGPGEGTQGYSWMFNVKPILRADFTVSQDSVRAPKED